MENESSISEEESQNLGEIELEEIVEEEEEEEEEVDPRKLLTKEQVSRFKEVFEQLDVERKEKVHVRTIGFVLRLMGLNPTKAEIQEHIKEIDPNNKGYIDFYSFLLPIAQKLYNEPETHEDIIAAFKVLDETNEGSIPVKTLYEYLTSLGEDLEDYEIELFLKMADPKKTGQVHYQEFVEKMMGVVKKQSKVKSKKDGKKNKKKKKKS